MKTAILDNSGFSLMDAETPKHGVDEVVVRVSNCGVCSGDFHLYQVKSEITGQPLSLGHEVVGTVVAVGENVTGLGLGDVVTAVDGVGGYSEYFVAPQHFLAKLPQNASQVTFLGEPIACCVHAVNRLHLSSESKVALVGCGFMGLVCQQILVARGVTDITAFDLQAYRREMAEKMGAKASFDPTEYTIDDVSEGAFDIVIEAAGAGSAMTFCGDLVSHHGQILIVGYHQSQDGMRRVNMQQWNYKAIDVFNGHVRDMSAKYEAMIEGLDMAKLGQIDLTPLVKVYSLDNIAQAFSDLAEPSKQLFKAVIQTEACS